MIPSRFVHLDLESHGRGFPRSAFCAEYQPRPLHRGVLSRDDAANDSSANTKHEPRGKRRRFGSRRHNTWQRASRMTSVLPMALGFAACLAVGDTAGSGRGVAAEIQQPTVPRRSRGASRKASEISVLPPIRRVKSWVERGVFLRLPQTCGSPGESLFLSPRFCFLDAKGSRASGRTAFGENEPHSWFDRVSLVCVARSRHGPVVDGVQLPISTRSFRRTRTGGSASRDSSRGAFFFSPDVLAVFTFRKRSGTCHVPRQARLETRS